jgi:septum formation protein
MRGDVPPFVLASSSAGRLRVLRNAGIDPEVVVSGVDETVDGGLDTETTVGVLAERKASFVAGLRPDALVLGCDSLLGLDQTRFGKPASAGQAVSMWRRLSGRDGTLFTGHCLIEPDGGRRVRAVASTVVRFGTPSDEELAAYAASGEPLTMAGAFSIEGLAAPFVDGIDGDPGTVIGLSMPTLRRMLIGIGMSITDLWRQPGAVTSQARPLSAGAVTSQAHRAGRRRCRNGGRPRG